MKKTQKRQILVAILGALAIVVLTTLMVIALETAARADCQTELAEVGPPESPLDPPTDTPSPPSSPLPTDAPTQEPTLRPRRTPVPPPEPAAPAHQPTNVVVVTNMRAQADVEWGAIAILCIACVAVCIIMAVLVRRI